MAEKIKPPAFFAVCRYILTLKEIVSGGLPQYEIKELTDKLSILKKPKMIPSLARMPTHLTQIDAVCSEKPIKVDHNALHSSGIATVSNLTIPCSQVS